MIATCLFWDDNSTSWSDRGCVQAPSATRRTSDGFVHCRCNHLTDFGGVAIPTSPAELLDEFTSLRFNTFTLDELVRALGLYLPKPPHISLISIYLPFSRYISLHLATSR